MQILKAAIRDAIVKVAREEIYKKGFENTSMRVIAEKANITAGNLYRYFKNKENIYEVIVNPAVNALVGYFNKHNEMHDEYKSNNLTDKEVIEEVAQLITGLFLRYKKEIIILMNGSKNTKYSNIKEQIIELLGSNIMDHFKNHYQKSKLKDYRLLARSIAISILEGCLEIIRNANNDKEMTELVREYFGFYSGLLE